MQMIKKEYLIHSKFLVFLLLCSTLIIFTIKIPFSTQGILYVSVFDFLAIIMWTFFLANLIRKKPLTKSVMITGFLGLLLLIVYLIVSVYRYYSGGDVFTSLIAIRAVYVSFIIYLMLENGFISKRSLGYQIVIFHFLISILYTIGLCVTGNIRFALFNNLSVHMCIMLGLLPLSFFYLSKHIENNRLRNISTAVCMLNIILTISLPFLMGLRVQSMLVVITSVVCIVVCWKTGRGFILKSIICIIVSIIIIIIFYHMGIFSSNFAVELLFAKIYGNDRIPITISEETYLGMVDRVTRGDEWRMAAWANSITEFLKSPLIGTGVMSFERPDYIAYESKYPAHNFILEYLGAFGGIGFTIWVLLYYSAFRFAWKKIKKSIKNNIPTFAFFFLPFINILGISFFQPTLLATAPNIVLWIMLSLYNSENMNVVKAVAR